MIFEVSAVSMALGGMRAESRESWPLAMSAPTLPAVEDPSSAEVGLRFSAEVDGFISGVRFFKGAAFSVEAPNFVELLITDTEPGFKGDTASTTYKPATVETGFTLQVPLFINTGDRIRIDTRVGEYMERA